MWCSNGYASWFLCVQSKFLPNFLLIFCCLQDPVVHVRQLLLLKLHQYLKDRSLPLKFASGFALCAVDPVRENIQEVWAPCSPETFLFCIAQKTLYWYEAFIFSSFLRATFGVKGEGPEIMITYPSVKQQSPGWGSWKQFPIGLSGVGWLQPATWICLSAAGLEVFTYIYFEWTHNAAKLLKLQPNV